MKRLLDKIAKNPIRGVTNWLRDWWLDKHKLRFKSYIGNFTVSTPVVAASRIRPKWRKEQTGDNKFHDCPGMLDYANTGYIVTAHTDIHIIANEVGGHIRVMGTPVHGPDGDRLNPGPFDYGMVKGLAQLEDDVKGRADKIPLPWSVQFPKGYSAYVMPAIMHAEYLDNIFVYPGVVHFDKYHQLNFVYTARKVCDFVIPAGTPLLHIIPFKREDFVAVCDKATIEEREIHLHSMPSRKKRYYRRFLADQKSYKMECPFDHRGK